MSKIKQYPDTYIPAVSLSTYIFGKLDNFGDKPALIDAKSKNMVTFSNIKDVSPRVANYLIKINVKKGDIVAIFCPNIIEYAFVVYGTLLTGAILMPIGILFKEEELVHQLAETECRIIFTVADKVPLIQAAKLRCPCLEEIIVIGDSNICTPFKDLLQCSSTIPKVKIDPNEDVAFLLYSSGTTGLPKGVMLTHYNILACATRDGNRYVRENANTHIGMLPFYHAFGLTAFFVNSLALGITIICISKFQPDIFLSVIQQYKPSSLLLTPPTVRFLINHPQVSSYDISSIEVIYCGSAPIDGTTSKQLLKKIFPHFRHFIQVYGMTELSGVTHISSPDKTGSIGKGLKNMMSKIVEPETGTELKFGEVGEFCFKGPVVMKGYYKKPEITAQTIKNGWLYTGDCGYIDAEGYAYIIDRYKELIKCKGFQVAPTEIENILNKHPGIQDSAVIGIPSAEAGELPKAFVVRKHKNITEEEIQEFVKDKLAPYKWLKGGVEFLNQIPKSLSGKILRRKLKEISNEQKILASKL